VIKPEDLHDKRLLLSPLNWGMGHVSRCIGIIHQLKEQGNEVFVACDIDQQMVFSEYFDDLKFISHAGYPFHFGGKGNFGWDLLSRSNSLRKRLKQEREEVGKYIKEYQIDIVLSDHRYGFISDEVTSVFITHQVNLPVKWYEKGVDTLHTKLMKRFDFIWVLDDEKSTLAGKLSENCPENGCYIGHYSRFSLYDDEVPKTIDHVLVASGPEEYAKQLIEDVLSQSERYPHVKVVHSTSLSVANEVRGAWKVKDQAIRSAKEIISYSGYSTLMDCLHLNVPTHFSPTKGQAEQEYLAKRWKQSGR
jgi:UDP:flavonoid glycosyltransferase YjiC (YdhE family)